MAYLYLKQGKNYSQSRPNYPEELFHFIASKTPHHDLVWDAGTGNGQAASSLAKIYKNVIATDTSQKQLELASRLPNVQYKCTSPTMSAEELETDVAKQATVDLVTVGQAIHWFDRPKFYQQVQLVLKKPQGIIAAWCYTTPQVNARVDAVFNKFYFVDSRPYWHPGRNLIYDKYESIEFPFFPVEGAENTGPFEFMTEKLMSLDELLAYAKSGSAYETALEKGVDLMSEDVIEEFRSAWAEDGNNQKVAKFPIYLRIGKVGK
ncbi:putative methyltransferase DDB_G0268948 [Coffea eugenioides]|uniref:putative methyltransferase DDB_G0268948 n=1 Tax=Coffea eugenioides TaxID=49369 RepID=UPI000F60775E|nr:putative methyltransferase DDB_G0268948 [Coffea eugenioides]